MVSIRRLSLFLLYCCGSLPALKGECINYSDLWSRHWVVKKINTTFDNGSLGSCNDEERSELR